MSKDNNEGGVLKMEGIKLESEPLTVADSPLSISGKNNKQSIDNAASIDVESKQEKAEKEESPGAKRNIKIPQKQRNHDVNSHPDNNDNIGIDTVSSSSAVFSNSPSPSSISQYYRNDPVSHSSLLHRITLLLMPFLSLLYLSSFIDRSNLGNIKKRIETDIGISENSYGLATSMFFIPYVILEVPSNYILSRLKSRPQDWLARIIISWGLVSLCHVAVNGPDLLYFLRFLLGVTEAGFFPGIVYYMTFWFSSNERAQRLAIIFVAQPLAGLVGSGISALVLTYCDNLLGLAGWRWLFVVEGIPTIILGYICLYYLPGSPSTAVGWLSEEEREFLTRRMKNTNGRDDHDFIDMAEIRTITSNYSRNENNNNEGEEDEEHNINGDDEEFNEKCSTMGLNSDALSVHQKFRSTGARVYSLTRTSSYTQLPSASLPGLSFLASLSSALSASHIVLRSLYASTFSHRNLYQCMLMNFLTLTPVQAITFYLPSIVADAGLTDLQGNLLSIIPYGSACLAMVVVAIHSDRNKERKYHVIGMNLLGMIGFLLTSLSLSFGEKGKLGSIAFQLFCLMIAAAGTWSAKSPLMAFFLHSLKGNLAVALASVTTVGNISGITTPLLMSYFKSTSNNYVSGCLFLMSCLGIASIVMFFGGNTQEKIQTPIHDNSEEQKEQEEEESGDGQDERSGWNECDEEEQGKRKQTNPLHNPTLIQLQINQPQPIPLTSVASTNQNEENESFSPEEEEEKEVKGKMNKSTGSML